MKPKYKIGDTVFFNKPPYVLDGKSVTSISFGVISKTTIQIDEKDAEIFYQIGDDLVEEKNVTGRAVIQKPRERKSRAQKAIDDLKSVGGDAEEKASA